METITQLEKEGFFGVDVNLEISLYEYGLICKETSKDNFLFYYGVGIDDDGNYNLFDSCNYSKQDIIELTKESWLNFDDVLRCCGLNKKEFFESHPMNQIYDLIGYYGSECIFGSSYGGFEVENN